MKTRKFEVITCPTCGREYLPAEIFYPDKFMGRPEDIVRDIYGRILDYEGDPVELVESYICDHCNTEFIVKARIGFATESTKTENFDNEYSAPLQHDLFTQT